MKNIPEIFGSMVFNDDADHYSAEDNLFSKINYVNYQYDNFRGAYLVSDPISGNKYIYDTVYSGDPTSKYEDGNGMNTYQNWYFSGDVGTKGKGYTLGVNQYLVMDFDMAFDAYANTNLNFTTRDSANTNIAGTGFHINEAMAKASGQYGRVDDAAKLVDPREERTHFGLCKERQCCQCHKK